MASQKADKGIETVVGIDYTLGEDGRLNEHLHEVDTQCYERVELLVEQMKARAGITEELKVTNQMKWVRSVMLRILKFLV